MLSLCASRRTFLGILLVLFASPVRASDWPSGIPIDDFPISYWCGPMPEFTTLERYREIKEAGFTFVMPLCAGTSV